MFSNFKKIFTIFLVLTVALFSSSVASAAPTRQAELQQQSKVVEKSANGNQVIEITKGDKKAYVVVSAPIAFKDLPKSEQLLSEGTKQADGANVQRTYLQFADSLTEAQQVATMNPTANASLVSPDSIGYFWHNSYIENWFNPFIGVGFHLHMNPVDVSWVTNVGWVAADTLAGALVAAAIVTTPVGVVIGGIATIAILYTSWKLQNNDGSIDIYSPDKDRVDSSSVSPGQYLGYAKNYQDTWNYFYWPSNQPGYSR